MKMFVKLSTWLLFLSSLSSQTTLPTYSVIKTGKNEAYLNRVNQLADQGYRVLIVGKYTVLRLDAMPPDTYRYLRLEIEGGPAQFTNWVNVQGARGYRWLPRTHLLEKAPHPRNYEYRFSRHGALGPSKASDLSSVVENGYRPLEVASFSHSLGSDTSEMFFEREIGQAPPESTRLPGTAIAIADAMRADNLLKEIDKLAKKGYRFLSLHGSKKGGGMAVMMQRCTEDCAGRYEYRYFDAKNALQVEQALSALGKDGFRVIPAALAERPHLLERDNTAKKSFAYRVVDPKDSADLQDKSNAAQEEGYVPLDFVWHAGWTAQEFLILEKETTVASVP